MSSPGDATETKGGRRGSVAAPPDLRLVLVGFTGAGKSSSGNTILGRKAFRVALSATSVTKECSKQTECVAGREITVVDTPGLFDTKISDIEILVQKISKCINMTAPGPHAILLVIKLDSLSKEEQLLVKKITAIFGEKAHKHTIVLFTHGDELSSDIGPDESIEEQIEEASEDLKDVLGPCGNRYHVFNNTDMEDRYQVVDLLEKVDALVAANGGRYYTSDSYTDVEDELKKQEKKLRKEFEKKIEDIKKELETKFSKEQNKLDARFNEFKRYYEAKIRDVKLEAEQRHIQKDKVKMILSKLRDIKI